MSDQELIEIRRRAGITDDVLTEATIQSIKDRFAAAFRASLNTLDSGRVENARKVVQKNLGDLGIDHQALKTAPIQAAYIALAQMLMQANNDGLGPTLARYVMKFGIGPLVAYARGARA